MGLGWLWWRAWAPWRRGTFAWQARHLATSAFVSRGRCGTWRHPLLHVAGMALMGLGWLWWRTWAPWCQCTVAWQAWHLATSAFVSRGKCGTWRHLPSFHVAGVAWRPLPSFQVAGVALVGVGWLWWRAWAVAPRPFCVAGAACTCFRFTWQVWTWRHLPSFHVAGVALMGLGWLWWRAWAAALLRGRRGTWRHLLSFYVYLRFTWQAWHLDWARSGGALGRRGAAALLRGRRGTWRHLLSFYVAGVDLATSNSFHVAGVALMGLGWLWWRLAGHMPMVGEREAICSTPRLRPAGGRQCDVHRSINCINKAGVLCVGCQTAVAGLSTGVGAHLVGPMWKDLMVAQRW